MRSTRIRVRTCVSRDACGVVIAYRSDPTTGKDLFAVYRRVIERALYVAFLISLL